MVLDVLRGYVQVANGLGDVAVARARELAEALTSQSVEVSATTQEQVQTPINMVASGPTMPTCEAAAAPMRSTAIMISKTGKAVQTVALTTESHRTCGPTAALAKGRNIRN